MVQHVHSCEDIYMLHIVLHLAQLAFNATATARVAPHV